MPLNYSATGNYPQWYAGPEERDAAGNVLKPGSAIYKLMQILASKLEASKDPKNYPKYEQPRIAEESPLQEQARGIAQNILNSGAIRGLHNQARSQITHAGTHNVLQNMEPYLRAGTQHPTENLHKYERGTKDLLDSAAHFSNRNLIENVLPKASSYWISKGHANSSAREKKLARLLRDSTESLHHVGADIMQRARETGLQSETHHAGHQLQAAQHAGTGTSREIERDLAMAERAQQEAGALQASEAQKAELANALGTQEQSQRQRPLDLQHANFQNALHEPERIGHMITSTMAGTMGAVPHETVNTSISQPSKSLSSVLGEMGIGAVGNMMRPNAYPRASGGPIRAEHNAGGRVTLAGGGNPPINPTTLESMMQMVDPGMANKFSMMKGFNPDEYALPPSPQPAFEMPEQQQEAEPQQQEMQQPQQELSPLQRGAQEAMDTINSLHMQKMQRHAERMEQPSENALGSYLANLGASMAANPHPELSVRLGQAAPHAQAGYEHANKINQARQDTASKLHMEIQKTIALQKYREMQAGETKRHHQAMENKPIYRSDPVSGGTFQISNGQATPVPGAPAPLSGEDLLGREAAKAKVLSAAKGTQKSIDKMREDAEQAEKTIQHYENAKQLLSDPELRNQIGPLKGEFFNNKMVRGLLTDPTKLQEFEAATSKLVLEEMASQKGPQSDPDRQVIERGKPGSTDTPEAALYKTMTALRMHERTLEGINFKEKMWHDHSIPLHESSTAYKKWVLANPISNKSKDGFNAPHDNPMDYLSESTKKKIGYAGNSSSSKSSSGDVNAQELYKERLRAHVKRLKGEASSNPTERILSQSHGEDIYDT